MDGRLRAWIVWQRNERTPLTERLLICEAQKLTPGLHDLEDRPVERGRHAFCRRRGITSRRIGSGWQAVGHVVQGEHPLCLSQDAVQVVRQL